ncbi:LysR family transcriptional regulator [Maritalea myrionectae]|uniref:Putative HTH-type transcriptional regulator YhjC n=1 Tax=Maritalea myrionectae TaxID=454601 RepID=A0A2R4MD47_9HYPH|nr:LysR family transcriptional regulator [Maritalea myrionectae]AVX03930.1 putative HTH-type transcriptional regulator YhjC [Maritalea myrionectae]
MDMLNAMQTFVAVAENHGITAASERLGCSKAIVSRTLSLLEERLDVRLLNRTTRRVSLTEAGSEYLEHCRNILEQNAEIESRFAEKSLEPQGRLRIAVPVTFGSQYVAPLLPKFLERHNKVQVDLHMSDRYVDIIEEGMDMAIRIGATGSDSLIVRKFAETHHKLAASPELIKKMGGKPKDVSELKNWPSITYSLRQNSPNWQNFRVAPDTIRTSTNNGDTIVTLAEASVGYCYLPTFILNPALERGSLVPMLEDEVIDTTPLYVLYPHRRRLPLKTRVFIDFMVENFSDL